MVNRSKWNAIVELRSDDWEATHSYRSYWDLYAEILSVCYGAPRTISFIVQATNQKYVSVREHLDFLVGKGLLEEKEREKGVGTLYQTSSSGVTYLERFLDLWNHVFGSQKKGK